MGGLATKLHVSNSLLADPEIRVNVPETRLYSKLMLKTMLERYKMVYVKPNMGTGGKGVIRVDKVEEGSYKYQLLTTANGSSSFDNMAQSIEMIMGSEPYVMQRGIHLLRHHGRLFDLRVMVQKNLNGEWETTGVIGRLGHPKKIITNVCRGGVSMAVEDLLRDRVLNMTEYIDQLRLLGYKAACHLNKTFPLIKELGFDIGIGQRLHPWIIEANPRPKIYGFLTLKDKSIYRKMRLYQESYGR